MPRVVVIGSINMDVVARTPRHPAVGETVLGRDLRFAPGGKGSNQAVAACRLAATTELVARVGADSFGDWLLAFLDDEKVGHDDVRKVADVATGTALIVVGDDGDNTIVVVPGANYAVTTDDIDQIDLAPDDVVVAQYELPLDVVHAALARAHHVGARTILNPAPAQATPPALLALADFLVVNKGELAALTRSTTDDTEAALRALRQRPDQVVIATLGARGSVALIGERSLHVPGRSVPVVDTTGAGDCFVGALAAAMCSWAEIDEAIHFANLAASIAVQRPGAGIGMPQLADLEALL